MLKMIIAFIKTHTIATVITTTVVVGTAVATPIIVDNYSLNKNVKDNIHLLAQSETDIVQTNETNLENNVKPITVNENEPLTFRIEKVVTENAGSGWMVEDGIKVEADGGTLTEYKIIPSYDKDLSKWTKAEKEAYIKVAEEANKMAKADYENTMKQEEQSMADALKDIEKIEASYSDNYVLEIPNTNFYENWKYNSYTGGYLGDASKYNVTTNKGQVNRKDFRNIVYPAILTQLESAKNKELERINADILKQKEQFRADTEQYYKEKGISYTWNENREYESNQLKNIEQGAKSLIEQAKKHFQLSKDKLEELYHLSD